MCFSLQMSPGAIFRSPKHDRPQVRARRLQPPASCSNNILLSHRPIRHSTLLLTSAEGEAQLGSISRRSSPSGSR